MSLFFIDRPVFAWVIGLILMLVGGVAVTQLPIAQYPTIAPPEISITVTYPGASAQTVDDTVVRPIQQQMSGLDGLEYISSTTQASGVMEIDLTFKQGTDPNVAQVQVQNKLSLATATLPQEVTQQGIRVTKATKNFMMIVGFVSTDGSLTGRDLSDYVASNVQAPLSRVTGVGDYTLFGSEYALRIWLDPGKLYNYALTVGDVIAAVSAQNVQVSSGELGGLPSVDGQRLDATIIGPPASSRRRSSRPSCSRPRRTARGCSCATSPAWSSDRRTTRPSRRTTTRRRRRSPSSWRPAPTSSPPRPPSAPG